LGELFERTNEVPESEVRNRILAANDINDKFDIFVRHALGEDSLILEPLFVLGGSAVIFLTIVTAGRHLLPKLAPKSGILIGSYESVWRRYDNLVRFIIFVGVFGSILTWIVGTLLELLIF
jgi:hypothetical protein